MPSWGRSSIIPWFSHGTPSATSATWTPIWLIRRTVQTTTPRVPTTTGTGTATTTMTSTTSIFIFGIVIPAPLTTSSLLWWERTCSLVSSVSSSTTTVSFCCSTSIGIQSCCTPQSTSIFRWCSTTSAFTGSWWCSQRHGRKPTTFFSVGWITIASLWWSSSCTQSCTGFFCSIFFSTNYFLFPVTYKCIVNKSNECFGKIIKSHNTLCCSRCGQ